MRYFFFSLLLSCIMVGTATADLFDEYQIRAEQSFLFPTSDLTPVMGVLRDGVNQGRLIAITTEEVSTSPVTKVHVETAVGSRVFEQKGTITASFDPDYGPAFLSVSPQGTQIAVGNNIDNGFTVFDVNQIVNSVGSSNVFSGTSHILNTGYTTTYLYSATWLSETQIAMNVTDGISSPLNEILVYDFSSPLSRIDIAIKNPNNSTGMALDGDGNLYFGDGAGALVRGEIRGFDRNDINAILADPDNVAPLGWGDGTILTVHASGTSIGFDAEGNAVTSGLSSVFDISDGVLLYDPDTMNERFFFFDSDYPFAYTLGSLVNPYTNEIYAYDGDLFYGSGSLEVQVISTVPEPSTWLMMGMVFVVGGFYFYRKREHIQVESKAIAA